MQPVLHSVGAIDHILHDVGSSVRALQSYPTRSIRKSRHPLVQEEEEEEEEEEEVLITPQPPPPSFGTP